MKKNFLNIPPRADAAPTVIDVREAALKRWIESLPLMDYSRSCDQITEALHDLNCHRVKLPQRIEAMTLLSSRVDKLHKMIPRNFESDTLPLSEKKLESILRPHKLLDECAIGHKIIISDLAADKKLLRKHKKALFFSIVKALHYMSLELIERYLIYRTPEEGTWQDIHKLYGISEKMGVLDIAISGNAAQGEASTSINELYKKILLLSLADMSRLMAGEAETVYNQLAGWSKMTSLSNPDDSFRKGVVVDLGIDAPANHVNSEKPLKFLNGRIFDLSRLLSHMEREIEALGEEGKKGSNMLGARARQAMYIRLHFTWGTHCDRSEAREPIKTPIKLISGLHDCHRGLSGDDVFNPEYDELRFDPNWMNSDLDEKPGLPGEGSLDGLSLVSEEETPWEKEQIAARAASNFSGNRVSRFDENGKNDAWEKIYSNQLAEEGRQKKAAAPLVVTECAQVDTSPGGMAIVCGKHQVGASLAVGKVVAITVTGEEDNWQTGVVRWLIMLPNDDIRFGVQILSDRAETVATKAVRGVGDNGEYFRAMIIPAEDGSPASIIVPAAVYSTNTIVSMVGKSEIKYLSLKTLLNNSASYNQFGFDEVEKPLMADPMKIKTGRRNRRSL